MIQASAWGCHFFFVSYQIDWAGTTGRGWRRDESFFFFFLSHFFPRASFFIPPSASVSQTGESNSKSTNRLIRVYFLVYLCFSFIPAFLHPVRPFSISYCDFSCYFTFLLLFITCHSSSCTPSPNCLVSLLSPHLETKPLNHSVS
jgi:hypothetical protein